MPWVRLDDGFADHPKIEEVGPLAGFLHVAALCYCNRHLTDGFIPAVKVPRLAEIPNVKKHVAALVNVGMWLEDDGGYRLHDYLDYQPSKAEVEEEREAARKRMAAAREKKRLQKLAEQEAAGSAEVLEMFGRTGGERSGELRPTPARPVPSRGSSFVSTSSLSRARTGGAA